MVYFDAVLDDTRWPVFNGTPRETKEWLEATPEAHSLDVCIGATMEIVTVPEYLKRKR